ncbi:transglutaminase-like cysteine peptidase [Microvirga splendida]|uniref:transglutaminase-like cysteine peptidase n=1 Tax=Microvirga splendida TaxID=2795727 RepID=UPI0031BAB5D9
MTISLVLSLGLMPLSGTMRGEAAGHLSAGYGDAAPLAARELYCRTDPAACAFDATEPMKILLTPRLWSLVMAVNHHVNAMIRPRSDADLWKVEDFWSFPRDGYGDCEDYQLLKRRLLMAAGLPFRTMRMAVVVDESGAGHAVLMLRTVSGDLILDNRSDRVMRWHETAYTFVKRESQTGSGWVSLGWAVPPHGGADNRTGFAGMAWIPQLPAGRAQRSFGPGIPAAILS